MNESDRNNDTERLLESNGMQNGANALNDERTVLVFDLETTGVDEDDQIIQLAWGFFDPEGRQDWFGPKDHIRGMRSVWVRPTVEIKPEATEKHGKTAVDLVGEPLLEEVVDEFLGVLGAVDAVMGYNVGFDLRMMQQELVRIGVEFDFRELKIVDPFVIWKQMEDRTLETAHRRFSEGNLEGAHEAGADIGGTARVLIGMIDEFNLQEAGMDDLIEMCRGRNIDFSGHLVWGDDGRPTLACTKHSGMAVFDCVTEDRSYAMKYPNFAAWGYTMHPVVRDAFGMALANFNDEEAFNSAFTEVWGECPPAEEEVGNTVDEHNWSIDDDCPLCGSPTYWETVYSGDPEDPDIDCELAFTCDCDLEEYWQELADSVPFEDHDKEYYL